MKNSQTLPRYQNVKNYILEGVATNQWQHDQRLPSENELVELCSVSRMTARKALIELTQEGILKRKKGLGTFINQERLSSSLLEIKDIAEEIRLRGNQHQCIPILLQQKDDFDTLINNGIHIDNPSVFYSEMLHLENALPIQFETRTINPQIAAEYINQNFNKLTPAKYLMSIAPVSNVYHEVKAIIPSFKIIQHLKLNKNEACLHLHRKTWSGNQWATISDFYYPGERYTLTA